MDRGQDVVIGVDIGTTSTKAVAFTADGVGRASGQAGYRLLTPKPGYAEQDADEVADAVVEATKTAAAGAAEEGFHVAGIAFSAAMHCLLGLDSSGRPLTRVSTWADTRAGDQAARLRAGPRGLALHRRTGTPVHPMSPLVKLRWFNEREPDLFGRVAHWIGIKEYVLRRLTGEMPVDHGIASATGMFNLGDEAWDTEALVYTGVTTEQLPEPVPTTEVLELSGDGASELGLPAETPVVIGCSDGPLANLGLGAIQEGVVACSIGTSGAVRVLSDRPHVDERGRVFCYVLAPGRYVVGGAINNGAIVLDWCAESLAPDVAAAAKENGGSVPEALLELAAKAPTGSGGLLFLPYLLAERAPRWSGLPRGVYLGLTREHRREHLLRATIEGVSMQLALVLSSLGDAGVEVRQIRATGGFSRSPLWRKVLAGTFGRPIGFAESPEGSSLGAALLGMTSLGMLDSLDRAAEIVGVTDVEQPESGESELYARLLPLFEEAYDRLEPSFAALAALQEETPLEAPPPTTTP